MPSVKLNDAWLKAMQPPAEGRIEVRDLGCPGLILRMTKGGIASWSARGAMSDGRYSRVTLGTYPTVGLAEARKRAVACRASVQGGGDPIGEKRAKRAEGETKRKARTVRERWHQWADVASKAAMKGRGWSDAHAERVAWMLKQIVAPKLGNRPLADTTRADWMGLVSAAHKRGPAAAGNLLRVARAFLNHAEAAGWIALPLLPRKASILAPPVAARDRTLTDEELRCIWGGAGELSAKPCAFVRLLILTAARRGEVAGIAMGEVSREAALWALPRDRTKNRAGHVIPLHDLALAELAAVWPDDTWELDAAYKLLGRIRGCGLSGFSKVKASVDKASGVSGWDWHDLRRTARTAMSRLGVAREAAEAAINHVSGRSGLVGVYDRHDSREEALAALRVWQEHVSAVVTPRCGETLYPDDARSCV
ncbi:tyrosine-type recombinase/integrase [Neoroseomonas soli]|uniref:Integrase arm-type DNA-binding domain-containing protein n=1 Tax=Neoroseomonas soli TaxID=1081025 RepID=A0A9X9X0H4_9PROT|nr:integrase arm-type DNA-binding domain-containing protein [Neoroseomonas soli]MBR0672903.1 integrase arm-type DNA-binding domain-containing protein [Neoroseomonas soli]